VKLDWVMENQHSIFCAALKNNEDNNYKHIVMDPFNQNMNMEQSLISKVKQISPSISRRIFSLCTPH
jgi:hypothetical protein